MNQKAANNHVVDEEWVSPPSRSQGGGRGGRGDVRVKETLSLVPEQENNELHWSELTTHCKLGELEAKLTVAAVIPL